MTGFARTTGGDRTLSWAWEVKSVNGKGLDMRSRLPPGFEALEPVLRKALQGSFARGNFQVALTAKRADLTTKITVNQEILDQLIGLAEELRERIGAEPPRIEGLLALKGVLDAGEEEEPTEVVEARHAAMKSDLDACLAALAQMRGEEGERLAGMVETLLDEIEEASGAAKSCAALQPDALRQRLDLQLQELLSGKNQLSEDRLHQEVAILAAKADVREELDRLVAHISAAREHLSRGGAVGRKLDFLCQEFNREANTLCSKSSDVELTRIGLSLKSAIDQMREQVQNIE